MKTKRSRPAWAELAAALGVLGLGIFFAVGANQIRVIPTYARIGPRFFPVLVAAALIACGLLLAYRALRGERIAPPEGEDVDTRAGTNWRGLILLGAGIVLDLLLMERLGFILASTALFAFTSAGLGSRRHVLDIGIGLITATAAFLLFTHGLKLNLPGGPLGGLF